MIRPQVLAVLVLLMCSWAPPSYAQRRDGGRRSPKLEVQFLEPVLFGEALVRAGRYHVNMSSHGIALVDPTTMVNKAVVPYTESELSKPVSKPSGKVDVTGVVVVLEIRMDDRLYSATGKIAEAPKKKEFQLAASGDADLGSVLPQEKATRDLVAETLDKRYVSAVSHCATTARRRRWKTGDKRFTNCVCPLTAKWRLPHEQDKDLRIQHWLLKGRSGMTLTVTTKGKVGDCSVWVGRRLPTLVPFAPATSEKSGP